MPERKLEDYLNKPAKQLLPLIAFKVDTMDERLDIMNGSLSDHEKRLMQMEIEKEFENKYGLVKVPMNKKKMVAIGGGGVAVFLGLTTLAAYLISVVGGLP